MKKKRAKITVKLHDKTNKPIALPKIQKILTATDFSDASKVGLRYAVALAKKLKTAVELLHVIEMPSHMAGLENVVLARSDSESIAIASGQLTKLAKREFSDDLTVRSSVRTGKPFHEISAAARESAADLIVIATHGHTGIVRTLLGSTAERVVRHASCPVLTVPTRKLPKRTSKTPPFKLKRILVPIDFSTVSKDALAYAVLLAGHYGAEIVLLHIVEKFPIDYLLGRGLTNETVVPIMKQAETELKRIAGDLSKTTGMKATVIVREGKPFTKICSTAKTLGADMIVLTTHGFTGLKHVWLGSTAERIVRHAPCPVLVVRELISSNPSQGKKSR